MTDDRRFWIRWRIPLVPLGLVFRIAGANGELWFDEILSIAFVNSVHSPDEIISGINHDNNHFLNSLYLYTVGIYRPAILLRDCSILFGTAAIPLAGLVAGCRQGDSVVAAIAMVLFAVAYSLVNYGFETRGYAGLVFCILLRVPIIERKDDSQPNPPRLAGAVVLVVLSHLRMLCAAARLFLWRGWPLRRSCHAPGMVLAMAARQFEMAFFAVAILALTVFIGTRSHPFALGIAIHSTPLMFAAGYGRLWVCTLGICDAGAAPVEGLIPLALWPIGWLVRREGVYGYWGLSGSQWLVYRRMQP